MNSKNNIIEVGILLFQDVDVLDFAGPFEVFSLAKKDGRKLFNVTMISETGNMITACNGLKVVPNHDFTNHPQLDILIIPGGYGAEEIEIKNIKVLEWIKQQHKKVQNLASICTGALLLAECGIFDNKSATTHWLYLDMFAASYPSVNVLRNVKFVDEGKVISSAGISAGINMSFHLIKKLFDTEVAKTTAKRMEYDIEI